MRSRNTDFGPDGFINWQDGPRTTHPRNDRGVTLPEVLTGISEHLETVAVGVTDYREQERAAGELHALVVGVDESLLRLQAAIPTVVARHDKYVDAVNAYRAEHGVEARLPRIVPAESKAKSK